MLAESYHLGGSGGYSISVKSIEDTDERKIGVEFTCPGATAITTCDLTQPHHVIQMPKTSLPVSFVDVETAAEPSSTGVPTRFLLTFEGTKELKAAEEADAQQICLISFASKLWQFQRRKRQPQQRETPASPGVSKSVKDCLEQVGVLVLWHEWLGKVEVVEVNQGGYSTFQHQSGSAWSLKLASMPPKDPKRIE